MDRRTFLPTLALPGLPMRIQASDSLPQPDLGNLYPIINWISEQNPQRLSFLDSQWKSLDQWKRTARPFFREKLCYAPKGEPLSARVVKKEERDGFSLESVRITATAAYDIPAWVLIPRNRQGKAPGVIAIHCHGGNYAFGHEKVLSDTPEPEFIQRYRANAYGRPFTEFLARRGFVVLVIDGFYFGSRRLQVEGIDPAAAPPYLRERLKKLQALPANTSEWYAAVNSACGEYEHLTAKTIFTAGSTWPGILAWDDMRSVDYLVSRPEVDPNRIGCAGLSIGGLRTVHLIGADPRIKAACAVGWMTAFHTQLRKHLRNHTWMIYVPGLYRAMDFPDIASLTAPGALLIQQCDRDQLYPVAGMKGSVEKLEKVYRKAGIPERFKGSFYDVPHSFTPQMQEEAFAWFDKWL